jgi:hypothetical protein
LYQVDGCLRLEAWSGDDGLAPRAELESLLLAIEHLLVTAAHGDVPASRMPAVIGLEPIPGTRTGPLGAGWSRRLSCADSPDTRR